MVAQSIALPVDEEGRVTIPDETRRELGIKPGDVVHLKVVPRPRVAEELAGAFPLKPGVVADDDFGNLIREAWDEMADRIARDIQESDR